MVLRTLTSTADGTLKVVYKGKLVTTIPVLKPFPNEHAARQAPPGKFSEFRRGKLPGAPAGVSAIFGIRNVGGKKVSEIQSLRFNAKLWTPAKAKQWLKDNGFKTGGFEAAAKPEPKGVKKMTEPRTHDVLVHKANVPLMGNESLRAFTKALKDAGRDHIMQKFNISEDKGGVFPVEVFANKAVFNVIPDFKKPPSNDFHVALKFARNTDTGQFTFQETMKVTPVTTFVANDGSAAAAVAKDKEGAAEEPAEVIKAMDMDAWTPAPSMFAGVV